ncbi:pseudouridine-5'-phosphate glycosidase [Actinocatenispora rupis]|uniref:pseudouridine-5'-phosphate glycosidase n=1 Tax=Actinocatenispora rupis TaxID=519421 RepID=UPI001EF34E19|nr:pseudouridine-5'-phosphate glycosidase [Actinocatenispora rupis]
MTYEISLGDEVAAALADGRPVVALESTIISHGLPQPDNLRVAREIEATVRAAGAVPATIGMLAGRITVGLDDAALERLANADGVVKLSVRDLAPAAAAGVDGATTVAATSAIAVRAGIGVFATGGLGGVHRAARDSWDESADLTALSRTPICVVCAGVKSILDVPATLERLETLGVTVLGYRTTRFPGFYLTDSGYGLDWQVDSPEQIAAVLAARAGHGVQEGGVLVANPLPADQQIDPELHDRVLRDALAGMAADGVTGHDVTPYLLSYMHEHTGGESLAVNVRIILRNADLAARIAVARTDAH